MSQRKINSTTLVPAKPRSASTEPGTENPPHPGASIMEIFINKFYLFPPVALLQIITPDVLNKLGRKAAGGTGLLCLWRKTAGFTERLVKVS